MIGCIHQFVSPSIDLSKRIKSQFYTTSVCINVTGIVSNIGNLQNSQVFYRTPNGFWHGIKFELYSKLALKNTYVRLNAVQ